MQVLIYNPRDYPDTSSGGLVESLIPLQREIFLQIEPITVEAVSMLQKYPRDVVILNFNNIIVFFINYIFVLYSFSAVVCLPQRIQQHLIQVTTVIAIV